MEPIKPKHKLNKKINFKKQKLADTPIFVSPGVYTIERDTSVFDYRTLMEQMMEASRIPREMFGELDHPGQTRPRQVTTYEEYRRLFGHPIGISSRGLVREDGTFDLQSYDIVQNPGFRGEGTDVHVGGGESMFYNATTTMILPSLKKKKTLWGRIKGFFRNIYKK